MFKNKILRWIQRMSPGLLLACGISLSSVTGTITAYAAISGTGGVDSTDSSISIEFNDHQYSEGSTLVYNTCGVTITIIDPTKATYGHPETWFKCTSITKNEDGTYSYESESQPISKSTMPDCDIPIRTTEIDSIVSNSQWINKNGRINLTGEKLQMVKDAYTALGGDYDDSNMGIAYVIDSVIALSYKVSPKSTYKYGFDSSWSKGGYCYLTSGGTEWGLSRPESVYRYWNNGVAGKNMLYTYGSGFIKSTNLETKEEEDSYDFQGEGVGISGSQAAFNFDNWGIQSHFRKLQIINGTPEAGRKEDPNDGSGGGGGTDTVAFEATGSSGRDYPEFYTWNNSDQFDIGKGIPSSESYTNGYLANWWYGSYSWGRTKKQTKNYTLHWKGVGVYEVEKRYNVDGEWEYYTVERTYRRNIYVNTSRSAQYYAITKVNINELQTAKVTNDSIGNVSYSNWNGKSIYNTLPVTCIVNGQNLAASGTAAYDGYTTSASNHITWKTTSLNMGTVTWYQGDDTTKHSSQEFIDEFGLQYDADTTSNLTVSVHNDCLIVNGKTYVDSQTVTSNRRDTVAVGPAITNIDVQALSFNNENSGGDFKERYDQQIVTIPVEKKNGKYPTTITVTYGKRVANNGSKKEDSKYGAEAIWSTYKKNEPVVVHTPVISPITITDPETNTQLIHTPKSNYSGSTNKSDDTTSEYENTVYKLRLDGTYTMEFQPYQWFSNEFGQLKGYENTNWTADRYDSYVKDKTVRFPFDVAVTNTDGTEKYYKTGSDGYTEWIEVDNEFKFYIPTWVSENTTKFNGNNDQVYDIQFRVEAQNVTDENGNADTEENTANTELANHVATYHIYANVSGWIYNFQIVGTNDKDMFSGYNQDASESTIYAFVPDKIEKKSGTANRFSNDYVRYTLDGLIKGKWDTKDTLPLHDGSSNKYSGMGALWKGTTFAFSVKTIANLADSTDEIDITPTYRYVDADGNIHNFEDIRMYYSDSSGNYIEYGSAKDQKNVKKVKLGNEEFKDSWYEGGTNYTDSEKTLLGQNYLTQIKDNLQYTVNKAGSSKNAYLNKETSSYTLSSIKLKPSMRILSGDPEELQRNEKYKRTDSNFDKLTNFDGNNIDSDTFKSSMQTWYGQYTIPNNLYVTYKNIDIDGDGTTSTLDSKRGESGYHAGDDIDGDGQITLKDYADAGKLSSDSDIWLTRGYLILNFDIVTKNNGNEHLRYGADTEPSENMWKKEKQPETVPVKKQTTTADTTDPDGNPEQNPNTPTVNIPVESGDIAIIDLRYKLTDKYSPRIFSIN